MIRLKPVGTNSVTIRYARDMGNNKVRHYVLPLSLALVKKFVGQDAQYVIRDYIRRTENEKDVIFEETGRIDFFDVDEEMFEKKLLGQFLVTDVSKMVLGDEPKIGRALMKRKIRGFLHQSIRYTTIFHKIFDNILYLYNKLVPSINLLLYRLQGQDPSEMLVNPFIKQLPYAQSIGIRCVDPVHFISVAFEANDAEEAVKAFKNDLRTLYKKNLIIGHSCMPSMMPLTDMVGLGRYFTIFCFLFIDNNRLMKLSGYKTPLEMPQKDQLSAVGVKFETMEGDIKWLDGKGTADKFEIEEVWVTDLDAPNRQQAVLDAYAGAVDHVNAVAGKMKESLKGMEKTYSNSRTVIDERGRTHVVLDAEFENKKTNLDINVAAHYNRNKND